MQHPNHAPGGGGPPFLPPPPPPSQPQLPPGWEQAVDPGSGRPYFANRTTGETSWTPPPYFPPPPPPPPPPVMQPPPHAVMQALPPHNMQMQQQGNHFHHEQPQMMYPGAQPIIAQPMPPAAMMTHNIPGNIMPMQPNYPQQYPPNQMQIETQPHIHTQAIPPNPHIPMPQQQEPQNKVSQSSISGLGPSTATTPGLLVPSVRAMIDEEYTQKSNGTALPKLELEGLTAGVIADLCNVSRDLKASAINGGDFSELAPNVVKGGDGQDDEGDQYYKPLQPFALPVPSQPPHIEPGRVDIRLHALHSKLGKI